MSSYKTNDNPLFTVIIVNWNTKELTLAAIASVLNTKETGVEVIVVDNASEDGSVEAIRREFPNVTLVRNSENLGFSKANNIGIRMARGEIIVLLNSDARIISRDAFSKIERTLQRHEEIGILGGRLVLPSGALESLGRSFLSLKELIKMQLFFQMAVPKKEINRKQKLVRVDYVAGAFLAIRRKVIEEIGLLDESFFMYGEDMEWCARAQKHGWQVMVLSEVAILHHHAASSVKNYKRVLLENAINTCRFLSWRYGSKDAKIAFDIYILGMALRIPLSVIRRNGLGGDYASAFIDCIKLRKNLKQKLRR